MPQDQIILFGLLVAVFGLLIWGKWRYDLVAFGALVAAIILGVVPSDKAFDGFGHPATVIIALVLIVSRGLSNSGAIELIAKYVVDQGRALWAHITILSGVGAGLSAIMNNVGALALLMPIDIQAAHKAKRSPALSLMPLSFATILGGMVTLIGTPPNIIIASFRGEAFPEQGPFTMFDFSAVGGAVAIAGVAFIALIGWRLIPSARHEVDSGKELFEISAYVAEVNVPEDSPVVGKAVYELDEECDKNDVVITGVIRRGKRQPGQGRRETLQKGDVLVIEASAEAIDGFVGAMKLDYVGSEQHGGLLERGDLTLVEVVVPHNARIEGRSALSFRLLHRHGITLLGVSRQGQRFYERVRKLSIKAGDILVAFVGKAVYELDEECDKNDVVITGVIRRGKRQPGQGRRETLQKGDVLVIEASAEAIDGFVGAMKLDYVGSEQHGGLLERGDLTLVEVVVPHNARIEGRSALSFRLLHRHGITLLGVSRQGQRFYERVRKLSIKAGDILLLLGSKERLDAASDLLGTLPLATRGLQVINRSMAFAAGGSFAAAIALASLGYLYLPVALALVCIVMVGLNIVPLRELYDSIEWPVIVLLGSMIPIGAALESSGGTALIAQKIVDVAVGSPHWVVLTILMIVTMTLSDVLNNTATTVIAAPIAVDIATKLGVNADPFLMAVAVAASCAFLTPIGHKNNTLIMGPGGYKFGDYWRMGLPLEVLVVAIAIPMILIVWPF